MGEGHKGTLRRSLRDFNINSEKQRAEKIIEEKKLKS
jgi:hypothetical protein